MLEQKKKQAAEEEERALDAKLKYEKEKENAVKQAIESERKDRDEYVENQIRIIVRKLKEQAKMDLENELILQEEILQVFIFTTINCSAARISAYQHIDLYRSLLSTSILLRTGLGCCCDCIQGPPLYCHELLIL